jgi:type II secretion system protein N
MRDGLTIEQIDAGTLRFAAEVEEGVANVTDLAAEGEDIELRASGTIRLVKPMDMSRLDLLLRIAFKDSYREKSDRTRALFTAMDMLPELRAARTTDGALQYRLTGAPGSRMATTPAGRSPAPGGGR